MNASGTHKLPMFVIGHAKKPRCFSNWNPDSIVDWNWNAKAWMSGTIWKHFLHLFNDRIRLRDPNRKVLLIIDNCPAHIVEIDKDDYPNVKIVFLPPNTTSHIQPCDAGIIASLKMIYRKQIVSDMIEQLEMGQEYEPPDLKKALHLIVSAWNKVCI
jgi:hypothetical protein